MIKHTIRLGKGKGMGKGYKNLIAGYDKRVHQQSGKGICQPQKIQIMPTPNKWDYDPVGYMTEKGMFLVKKVPKDIQYQGLSELGSHYYSKSQDQYLIYHDGKYYENTKKRMKMQHSQPKKIVNDLLIEKRDAVSMEFYGRPYGWGDASEQTEVDEAIEVGDDVVELLSKGIGKSKAIIDVSKEYGIDPKLVKQMADIYEKKGVMYGKTKMQHGSCSLKHGKDPDSKFNSKQLKVGTKVETEHTNDKSVAKQIAKAHLDEDPKYYDKLKKVETMGHNQDSYFKVKFKESNGNISDNLYYTDDAKKARQMFLNDVIKFGGNPKTDVKILSVRDTKEKKRFAKYPSGTERVMAKEWESGF